jgi:hypothetical protein
MTECGMLVQLLGFPTHAAFVTDARMAKTPEAVLNFLRDLSAKLTPLADAEMAVLLQLKVCDCDRPTVIGPTTIIIITFILTVIISIVLIVSIDLVLFILC